MKTRFLRLSLWVFIAGLFALALPDSGFAQQPAPEIIPVVNCVVYNPHGIPDNTLGFYFGYVSTYTTTVTIPVGNNNFFFPRDQNLNQPVVFEPGIHDKVFFTLFQPTVFEPELTWFVNGNGATGTQDPSLLCNLPAYAGDWSSGRGYKPGDLVRHKDFLWVLPLRGDGTNEPGVTVAWSIWPGPIQGPRGPQGPAGPQGAQGAQGLQGTQGAQGTQGLQGTQGTQGTQGLKGDQGSQGAPGPQGLQGIQGATGPAGPLGPLGPQGPQGSQGPQGPSGPTGPAGNPNIFPSSQVYTFVGTTSITISDPHVVPTSLILVQYVLPGFGGGVMTVTDVQNGKFTVTGTAGRQFRYVVLD